jgi:hypothetical protein
MSAQVQKEDHATQLITRKAKEKKQRKTTTRNKMTMIRVALPPLGRVKTWRSYG